MAINPIAFAPVSVLLSLSLSPRIPVPVAVPVGYPCRPRIGLAVAVGDPCPLSLSPPRLPLSLSEIAVAPFAVLASPGGS